jgi:hypothetical protein
MVTLYSQKHYGHTFTLIDPHIEDHFHKEIHGAAKELLDMGSVNRPLLFERMIDDHISDKTIHYVFSGLQYFMGHLSNIPDNALYSNLGATSKKGFEFPLHTDLYRQKILWILFNQVADDDSGRTVLLPIQKFQEILESLDEMPHHIKQKLLLSIKNNKRDNFNVFFNTLYKRNAPWEKALKEEFDKHQISIKFEKGEGYLLNDRKWLHGRTAPSNGVFHNRLYRMAFNSFETQ